MRVSRALGSISTATLVSNPACSRPKSSPPAPVNRDIDVSDPVMQVSPRFQDPLSLRCRLSSAHKKYRQVSTTLKSATIADLTSKRWLLRLRRHLLQWGRNSFREFSWRDKSSTPYEIAVAEILLKRTTATAAARAFPKFLRAFPDVSILAEADVNTIGTVLYSLLGSTVNGHRALRTWQPM